MVVVDWIGFDPVQQLAIRVPCLNILNIIKFFQDTQEGAGAYAPLMGDITYNRQALQPEGTVWRHRSAIIELGHEGIGGL